MASAGLTLTGYAHIVRDLSKMADELCNGRLLFILEGGYHHDVLAAGVHNVLQTLLGRDEIQDDIGPSPYDETDIAHLLDQLKQRHLPK